jgi:hypothetical protein
VVSERLADAVGEISGDTLACQEKVPFGGQKEGTQQISMGSVFNSFVASLLASQFSGARRERSANRVLSSW